ncbi:hypothetical protein [Parabacteroides sp. ZJ-118]|uniref:InlB B-repeat-containing protein n=1 Tax=Parabacteroides sp. ZJ-118 TaxID=2709398 RepID=UPI0013ECDE6D|nr:hypothetical protein [Parabacteroides sp. ZJ-118]
MNKIRKSLTMGLLLLLAAVTTTAQNVFSIKDTTVYKTEETETITLELALNNTDPVTALQFDLSVPQGMTLQTGSVRLDSMRIIGKHELKMAQQDSVTWRFVVVAANNGNEPLAGNSGTLMSLPVTLDNSFRSGRLTMKNIVLTDRIGNDLPSSAEMGQVFLVEKQKQSLQIFGLEQIVNPSKAAEITWEPKDVAVDVKYYEDGACTKIASDSARKAVGIVYVVVGFGGNETVAAYQDTLRMVITDKKPVNLGEKGTVLPTASTILEGQPLSTSILSGGKVVIATGSDTIPLPGTFAWTNGNELATTTGEYAVTFTPDDGTYHRVGTSIPLEVIPVYDVFVNNPENGSISATGLKTDNRYAKGEKLVLKALPAANYQFDRWSNGVTTDTTTWEVNNNGTISATFTPIMHTVSFSTTGSGALSIKTAKGETVSSGGQVQQGTELFITAELDFGYVLKELTLNGTPFTSGKFILGQDDVTFAAIFEEAESLYPVKANGISNGVIRLFKADADGTPIPSGTAMKEGESFKIMALPNAGYELGRVSFNGKDLTPSGGTNIFTATVTTEYNLVDATFTAKEYTLKITTGDGGTVSVTGNGKDLSNDDKILYGSTIQIKEPEPTNSDSHKFTSLVINGRKIETFPHTLTVNSDVRIAATFEELTTIEDEYLINEAQSYNYNGQDKRFFIYTTQTYARKFNITYINEDGERFEDCVIKADTYSLKVTRPADEIYKAYISSDEHFKKKLIIRKAKMAVKTPPTSDSEGEATQPAKVDSVKEGDIMKYTYTATGENAESYEPAIYYLSTKDSVKVTSSNQIWYDNSAPRTKAAGLRSARMMTKADTETAPVTGYVKVTNGDFPCEPEEDDNRSFSIREGTPITLEAIPAEGYKFVSWSDNKRDQTREFTVTADATLPTATFAPKDDVTASLVSSEAVYNGKIQVVSVSGNIENAQVNAYKDRECTQIADLKNVGEYWISIYRPENETALEVRDTVGFKITPAPLPDIIAPTTMEIAADETLAQVQLMGGNAGSIPGSFSWKNSAEPVTAGTKTYTAIFTSSDPNYEPTKEVKVSVTGLSVTSSGTNPNPGPTPGTDPDTDPDTNQGNPDVPTSIEEIASETLLVVREGGLEIHPAAPVEVAVVSINGKYLYNGEIAAVTTVRIPQPGIYIVSFVKEGKAVARKVRIM